MKPKSLPKAYFLNPVKFVLYIAQLMDWPCRMKQGNRGPVIVSHKITKHWWVSCNKSNKAHFKIYTAFY